jgi:small subunit ribosomal protein S6
MSGWLGRRYVAASPSAGRGGRTVLLPRKCRGRLSPKEVETALREYEVMVILDPDLEERTVAPSLDTYLNVVRKDGGSVGSVDVWGKRRLAYEIDKKTEGIYAVIDLTAEPATVKELDRQLSLNESVLRTKVMRPSLR